MISFDSSAHKYYKGSEEFISVTTLIKKYTNPFDEDYWSSYKAIKKVYSDKNIWDEYKRKAGGWSNVVFYARSDKSFLYKDEVIAEKKRLIYEWRKKKEMSAKAGSIFHNLMEEKILSEHHGGERVSDKDTFSILSECDQVIIPEAVLYSEEYKVAGKTDRLEKINGVINIDDYKTSLDVYKEPFMNKKMLYPVQHLDDCLINHYALQLSAYAYMIEMKGFKIGRLSVIPVKFDRTYMPSSPDDFQIADAIQVPYLKDEVESIMSDNLTKQLRENDEVLYR